MNVARRILSSDFYVPTYFDSNPPEKRWEGITNLKDRPGEHLNKITIRKINKLLKNTEFGYKKLNVYGFGESRKYLAPLDVLSKIPIINEMWHSYFVGICRK